MNIAGLIIANTVRNKRRTALTALSLAASVFLITTLESLFNYMDRHALQSGSATRIIVRRRTSLQDRLPESYVQKIAQLDGIEACTPMVWFGGIYKEYKPENFFGQLTADPETFQKVIPEAVVVDPATGRPAPDLYQEFKNDRQGAIVGINLFKKFGWKLGDRITIQGTIYPVDVQLNLRAAYDAPQGGTDRDTLYFHHKYLDESLGLPGQIGIVSARVRNSDDIPALVDKIDGMFANSEFETLSETEQAFQAGFVKMLGNLTALVHSIGSAVAFAMFMVAANTTAMAARERANEIAVMKAFGFEPGAVLRYLLIENSLIALMGSAIGALVAVAMTPFIKEGMQYSPLAYFFQDYSMLPAIPLILVAVGTGIGLVAAYVPCRLVSNLPIATTIRRLA